MSLSRFFGWKAGRQNSENIETEASVQGFKNFAKRTNATDIDALKLYYKYLKDQNKKVEKREAAGEIDYVPKSSMDDEQLGEEGRQMEISDEETEQEEQEQQEQQEQEIEEDVEEDGQKFDSLERRGERKRIRSESPNNTSIKPENEVEDEIEIPFMRQILARVEPMERYKLLQLKKQMQLESYYQNRINFLNFHNLNATKRIPNSTYAESSTQTNYIPELKSTLKYENNSQPLKFRKLNEGNALETSNSCGTFSGEYLYGSENDENENGKENEKENNVEKIEKVQEITKPTPLYDTIIPTDIAFDDNTKNKYGIKDLAPGMVFMLDKNNKKNPISPTSENQQQLKKAKIDENKTNSNFNVKTDTSKISSADNVPISGPSAGFNFIERNHDSKEKQKNKDLIISESVNANEESVPVINNTTSSFVNLKSDTENKSSGAAKSTENEKPTFSFAPSKTVTLPTKEEGSNQTIGFSFKPQVESEKPSLDATVKIPVSSTLFGSTTDKKEEPSSTNKNPLFSVNFGESKLVNNEKQSDSNVVSTFPSDSQKLEQKPLASFSFGTKSNQDQAQAIPSFSFGNTNLSTSSTNNNDDNTKNSVENKETKKSTFSFGNSAFSNNNKVIGSNPDENKTKSESLFETKKPFDFGGGAGTTNKAFSFGAAPNLDENTAAKLPETTQNNKRKSSNALNEDTTSTPVFSFGKKEENKVSDAKKVFSFGTTSNNVTGAADENKGAASGISFNNNIQAPKPLPVTNSSAFSFNSAVKDQTEKEQPKPAFSFGQSSTPTALSESGLTKQASQSNNVMFGNKDGGASGLNNNKKEPTPFAGSSGLVAPTSQPQPAFSFGGSSRSATPAFGSNTRSNTPSFETKKSSPFFGTGTQQQTSGNQFGGSSAFGTNSNQQQQPQAVGFQFGNKPATVAGNGGIGSAGTSFNQSRSTTPNFTAPNFNFTGASGSLDPSQVFGGAVNNNSTSSTPVFSNPPFGQQGSFQTGAPANSTNNVFGAQPQQANNIFGGTPVTNNIFGGPGTPVSGNNSNNANPRLPLSGRKMAQMRRRR
ncbi:hypothetical protein PACTADRAFT_49437 [Pachysolen tannophilus NRRL Y-2460]|uniref:Uncharacterized protein n=1 Tax=Pachysolen tannophilus NRRL Y-2460 TaxID=669874 RepID=A0A1E4TWA6_PACTA|nr:hypothetical protein PACTADRAFT_49437 [Pachysolen tannophilus NRRL Y-2460]